MLRTSFNRRQNTDAGLALALIFLLLGVFLERDIYYKLALPVIVLTMVVPVVLYPFSVFWFNFASLLGAVMSRIILSIVFFILVTPVGLLRRILGKDPLHLKGFKKGTGSVLIQRDHHYTGQDLNHPF